MILCLWDFTRVRQHVQGVQAWISEPGDIAWGSENAHGIVLKKCRVLRGRKAEGIRGRGPTGAYLRVISDPGGHDPGRPATSPSRNVGNASPQGQRGYVFRARRFPRPDLSGQVQHVSRGGRPRALLVIQTPARTRCGFLRAKRRSEGGPSGGTQVAGGRGRARLGLLARLLERRPVPPFCFSWPCRLPGRQHLSPTAGPALPVSAGALPAPVAGGPPAWASHHLQLPTKFPFSAPWALSFFRKENRD